MLVKSVFSALGSFLTQIMGFLIRAFLDLFRCLTMASFVTNSMRLEYWETVQLDVISDSYIWTQAMNGLALSALNKSLSEFSGSQPLCSAYISAKSTFCRSRISAVSKKMFISQLNIGHFHVYITLIYIFTLPL